MITQLGEAHLAYSDTDATLGVPGLVFEQRSHGVTTIEHLATEVNQLRRETQRIYAILLTPWYVRLGRWLRSFWRF
jgi:hypothetical protein